MITGSLDLKFTADIQAAATEIRRLEALTGGAMSSMQNATSGVAKTFAALGPVIAAALAAISVSAVVGQFQQLVKAAGDLQDLAEKTGATAEALGGLVVAAKVGGTTIDAVAAASIKLTKSLTGVDDESKAAGAAIGALGLNLKDFKTLSPTAQMEALAKALGGFEDGPKKTAVALAMLGKSGAEMLPFLKALDEAGGAHNILTAEQIRLADDYGDAQAKSRAEMWQMAQALAVSVLPAVVEFTGAVKDTIKELAGLGEGGDKLAASDAIASFARSTAIALATVVDQAFRVGQQFNYVGTAVGGLAAITAALASGDLAAAKTIRKLMSEDLEKMSFTLGLADKVEARFAALDKRKLAFGGISSDEQSSWKTKQKLEFDGLTVTSAAKKEASEYERLTAAIKAKIEAGKIEAAEGEKASESQKFQIKIAIEMASGKLKVTDAQKASLKVAIAELDTLERAAKVKLYDKRVDEERLQITEELAQAYVAESKAREVGRNAVVDYGKAIDDANALTRFEISLADQTDAGRERALAQYRIELDLKKQIEAIDKNAGFDQAGRDEEKARASAAAARASAGVSATLRLSEINKTRAEWDKFYDSIYQGLTDSLYRGFEAGKGFFKSFWDGIKNLFKTTVLKLAVQGVVTGVTGALGMNTSANAGSNMLGMANNVSTANSLYGAASGYSSGVNTAAALLGAGSTAGASAASLGYANAVGVVGGDALGALISANASWAGVATGSAAAAEAALAASAATAAGTTAAAGTGAAAAGAGTGAASGLAAIPVYGWIALAVIAVAAYFGGRGDKEATGGGIEGSFGKGGFEGNRFSTWKQDGGWFHGDRTGKDLGALDAGAQKQLAAGYAAVQVGAAQSALALGLSADAIVNYSESISIVLGDDQEANAKTISKLFADMSNNMATAVAPGLSAFAKQGETASTTLARLGGSLTTVNAWMGLLRGNLLDVSMASGDAASKLVDAFGGLEAMGTSVQHYYDLYFSESERAADTTARMTKALASVGLAMPETKEAFRAMATGLDLTSDSGRAAYATMLALAPTFAASADAIAALAKTAADKAQAEAEAAAGKALAVSEKHDELTLALLRAQGYETGAVAIERARELEALRATGPGLAELQSQLWGITDATAAAATAAVTAKAVSDKANELNLAIMRASGNEAGALAIERIRELDALHAQAPALSQLTEQLYGLRDATAAAATVAASWTNLNAAFDSVAADFLNPTALRVHNAGRMSDRLAAAGMAVTTDQILGAGKKEFEAYARSIDVTTVAGRDMVTALLGQWGAFKTLHPEIEGTTAALQALDNAARAAAGNAIGDLEKTIATEKIIRTAAYDAAVTATQDLADLNMVAAKAATDAATEAARARLDAITTIFNALDGALKSAEIQSDALTAARRRAAQHTLSDAMAGARAGQSLTGYAGLQEALSVIAQPSQDLFATFEEYAIDQARTATDIVDLRNAAAGQMSVADMTLAAVTAAGDATIKALEAANAANLKAMKSAHDADLDGLDAALAVYRQQLDVASGTWRATLDLATAIRNVEAAIRGAAATKAVLATNATGAAGQPAAGYGRATDAEIRGAWDTTAAKGVDDTHIRAFYDQAVATGTSSGRVDSALGFNPGTALAWAVSHGLPSFAVGTDYVPQDMLALIHQGEIITPADDAAAFRAQRSGDSSSDGEIRALRAEVRDLKTELSMWLRGIKQGTDKSADVLARADDGNGIVTKTVAEAEAT